MIRRVQRERIVALGGARALLMQAAHPVAFEGFFATTAMLADPYARLRRTADLIDTIVFGARADADRQTARVRRVHHAVRGRLATDAGAFAAGTRWAADDPDLLLWVLAALADSGLVVYERYVRLLSAEERECYWQDYRLLGAQFGLAGADMPADFSDFHSYMLGMLNGDTLHVTPSARALARKIVLSPPVPLAARPLLELANAVVISLLPAGLRRQYGLWWDPLRSLAFHGGAYYTRHALLPVLPARVRERQL